MTTQTFKISRTYPIRQYQNWISQTEELIDTIPEPNNVLFWGAKGNGITDDTVAIQEAITANLRGELFFPSGIYLITATLTIEDDITICGENYIYYYSQYCSSCDNHWWYHYCQSSQSCLV